MARLKKILGGLLNLTMVGDDAWITYGQASAVIWHAAIAGDGLNRSSSCSTTQETMPSLGVRIYFSKLVSKYFRFPFKPKFVKIL